MIEQKIRDVTGGTNISYILKITVLQSGLLIHPDDVLFYRLKITDWMK